MARTRRRFLGVATTSVFAGIAGCAGEGGDDDGGDTGGVTPTGPPTATPMETSTATETPTPTPQSVTLAVGEHPELGEILVDGNGRTVYMWDNDEQSAGTSNCTGSCAEAWPPLVTDGEPTVEDSVTADISIIERDDGSTQVVANGWPLYYYQEDANPGDVAGHGVGNDWWVLSPGGTPKRPERAAIAVRSHPQYGDILVDGEGMTLYMFDRDERGAEMSACTTSGCLNAWPPLTTDLSPTVGDVSAPVSTFEREDGGTQIAVNGWPLYYYSGDDEPGDAMGQGNAGIWWVLGPDGTPIREEQTTSTATPTPTPTDDDGVSY